jgi:hypothetical protein
LRTSHVSLDVLQSLMRGIMLSVTDIHDNTFSFISYLSQSWMEAVGCVSSTFTIDHKLYAYNWYNFLHPIWLIHSSMNRKEDLTFSLNKEFNKL